MLSSPVKIGTTAGLLILLLDLLLIGLFTLQFVSKAPGLVASLVGFSVITLGLLPGLLLDSRDGWRYFRAVLTCVGLVLLFRTC